jgi:hypothetical protein
MIVEEPGLELSQKEAPGREILVEKPWVGNAKRKSLDGNTPGGRSWAGNVPRREVLSRASARQSIRQTVRQAICALSCSQPQQPELALIPIPDGLDCLSKVFTAVNFGMLTTARPLSSRLGKL